MPSPGTNPARAGWQGAESFVAQVSLLEPLFSVIIYKNGDSSMHHSANVQQIRGTQTMFSSTYTVCFSRVTRFSVNISVLSFELLFFPSWIPDTLIPGLN